MSLVDPVTERKGLTETKRALSATNCGVNSEHSLHQVSRVAKGRGEGREQAGRLAGWERHRVGHRRGMLGGMGCCCCLLLLCCKGGVQDAGQHGGRFGPGKGLEGIVQYRYE